MTSARPIAAGIVTALVGFTSAFAVVLAGLSGVGATSGEASSGLLAVSVTMGIASIILAVWTRKPITVAWSTPGAALLAATGPVEGGWPAAVGAFALTGILIVLTGLIRPLGRLIAAIPRSIAQAMLAGVLLPLCLWPVTGAVENPWAVLPVILVWLVALRFAPRWAVPLAFAAAVVVIAVHLATSGARIEPAALVPVVELTVPTLSIGAVLGIALPLYLVTMASQNVAGVAVMRGLGYEVPWRASMVVTGVGTIIGAPAGGHAINLAAISAALAAGPEAGEDRSRRWIASVTSGVGVIVLGIASAAFVAIVLVAPAGVVPAVAGLALIATLGSSISQAIEEPAERIPALATFLVAASGIAVGGISAAFWALVVGVVVRGALIAFPRRRA
ncbi:MAG TPA: benzoate/H(+) symporter BenE family transporter [Microbacteriaceae bacterium]|nr:benzoate/H(+) symporter BenE family transporter [Microbacteriaceae bacterium]